MALADTLWKGRRSAELEERLGVQVATASGLAYWDLMIPLDDLFERIAAEGPTRLMSSAEVPMDASAEGAHSRRFRPGCQTPGPSTR